MGGFNNLGQLDDASLRKIQAEFRRQESSTQNLDEDDQALADPGQMSFSNRFLATESASLKKAQEGAFKQSQEQVYSGTDPHWGAGQRGGGGSGNPPAAQYSFKVNNYRLGNSNFSNAHLFGTDA